MRPGPKMTDKLSTKAESVDTDKKILISLSVAARVARRLWSWREDTLLACWFDIRAMMGTVVLTPSK